jgi:seryl-tRNA synthetase
LKRQICELQIQLSELQSTHQRLFNDLNKKNEDYQALSTAHTQLDNEKRILQRQLEEAQESCKKVNLEIEQHIATSNKEKNELKHELEKLHLQQSELLNKSTEYSNTITQLRTENEILESELHKLHDQHNQQQQQCEEGTYSHFLLSSN